MKLFAAIFLFLLFALTPPANAETDVEKCHTTARVAAFTVLLKNHPARAEVEDFIKKNNISRDKTYSPRKSPQRLVASISESNCNPLDYQHTQHIFDVAFKKGVVTEFSENLMSGGP